LRPPQAVYQHHATPCRELYYLSYIMLVKRLRFQSGMSSPYPDACTLHAGNCACTLADASFAALAVALLHVSCRLPLDLQLVASCTMPDDRYCPALLNIIVLLLWNARLFHLLPSPVPVRIFYAVPSNLPPCLSSGSEGNTQACQNFTC